MFFFFVKLCNSVFQQAAILAEIHHLCNRFIKED
jgi:hypothetical protein